jgi:hypothetical protein
MTAISGREEGDTRIEVEVRRPKVEFKGRNDYREQTEMQGNLYLLLN